MTQCNLFLGAYRVSTSLLCMTATRLFVNSGPRLTAEKLRPPDSQAAFEVAQCLVFNSLYNILT